MIRNLIRKNRSYRRFDESVKIQKEQILSWIDLARMSASGRNNQPLKYAIATDAEKCAEIFPCLGWAGYLKDWTGPGEKERPVAYIVVLKDHQVSDKHYCDDGIVMQSILLGAVNDGFGGCIIGTVNRKKIARILNLPEHLEILWIVALGKPAEQIVLEEVAGDVKYWRDDSEVHHVPKRRLEDVVVVQN